MLKVTNLPPSMAERFLDTPDYAQFVPRKSVGEGVFVYVVGGETTPGRSTVGSVERYNPSKNSWSCLAGMETSRRGVGVTLLNGLLYVVGGSNGIQALRSAKCGCVHTYAMCACVCMHCTFHMIPMGLYEKWFCDG